MGKTSEITIVGEIVRFIHRDEIRARFMLAGICHYSLRLIQTLSDFGFGKL